MFFANANFMFLIKNGIKVVIFKKPNQEAKKHSSSSGCFFLFFCFLF